jgi:outer membrane protein OmpA-like peptidoglycan-associated protein
MDSTLVVTDSNKAKQTDFAPIFCRQEFSVWMAGGISALNYNPSFGERTLNTGGAFGLGYTVYFHRKWGIFSGVEIALYNTTYSLPFLKNMYTRQGFDDLTPGWTSENEKIDYHTELSNYTEKQQQYNINIPLMLQFQTPLANGGHQFFAMAGAKLGVQLRSTYNVNTELYTWYYDHKTNQEFRPNPTNYGNPYLEDLGCFNRLDYSTGKQKNQFKPAGLAVAELGIKWRLNSKQSLYTGLYVDYGFNNIGKQKDNRFFEFDPVSVKMTSNSVLTSQYAHNGAAVKSFTEKVSPVAFGIKIRFGINMCKTPKNKTTNAGLLPAPTSKCCSCCHCACHCCCHTNKSVEECEKAKQHTCDRFESAQRAQQGRTNDVSDSTSAQTRSLNEVGVSVPASPQGNPNSYQARTQPEISEYRRAVAEYGDLVDLLVLELDGYEIDQSKLSPIMERMLNAKIAKLKKYNTSKYEIIVEGHTCDLGSESYNLKLARKRAEVVGAHLVKKGFKRSNITVVSKGESTPIIDNNSEAHRKINRRVVFLVRVKNK